MTRRIRSIVVSDHAVVRWLERVEGFDIVALKAQLARSAEVGLQLGAKAVVVSGGKLVLDLDDAKVVTVLRPNDYRKVLMGRLEISIAEEIELYRRAKRRRR